MSQPINAADAAKRYPSAKPAECENTPPPVISTMSRKTLAKVWVLGTASWGHRWSSALGEDPLDTDGRLTAPAMVWADGLPFPEALVLASLHGFTLREEWPPSLAAMRAACLGIPTLAFVREDIIRDRVKRHPFTRMVWGLLDSYAFTRETTDRADRSLRDAYDLARERVMGGEPLPADLTEIAADAGAADRQRAAELDAHDRHFGLGKYAAIITAGAMSEVEG